MGPGDHVSHETERPVKMVRPLRYPMPVEMFEENIRDGFEFDPIEVQVWPDPDNPAKIRYRILDGRHRWGAYKKTGATHIRTGLLKGWG